MKTQNIVGGMVCLLLSVFLQCSKKDPIVHTTPVATTSSGDTTKTTSSTSSTSTTQTTSSTDTTGTTSSTSSTGDDFPSTSATSST
jgi:hypothetical protein